VLSSDISRVFGFSPSSTAHFAPLDTLVTTVLFSCDAVASLSGLLYTVLPPGLVKIMVQRASPKCFSAMFISNESFELSQNHFL
jgi:hypothetical protein